MKRLTAIFLLTLALPAQSFELARWMGTWHEIASIPNLPQSGCTDTIVDYRLAKSGGFELSNTCWKADSYKEYRGHASPTEDPQYFRARFYFFLRSDYWIIAYDPQYQWGAVGTKDLKHLWIISRQPSLKDEDYQKVLMMAREKGFPVERLNKTIVTSRSQTPRQK